MELNERIKKARKEAGYKSRDDLADFLGSTRDTIAAYEQGRVVPNDVFLQLMATKLHISYEWLKNGVGEMFLKSDGNILSELAEEFNLKEDEKELIASFLNLTDEQRQTILEAVKIAAKISGKLEKQTPTEPPLPPVQEEPEEVTAENLTAEEKAAIKKMRIEKNTFNVNGGTINF